MRKVWSDDELLFLEDNIGMYKVSTIAQKLERSYESVRVKMTRLKISNTRQHTGLVTIGELAAILKVDRATVRAWTKKHGLPFSQKITRQSRKFYFIDPSEFWNWAAFHKEKIQFSNIDPQTLLPEPEWVAEERAKDQYITKKKTYQTWTTKEDDKLLALRSQGYKFKEIGMLMNRSAISVERRHKKIIHTL
ncbi:helix-turn-helix domain-containing protein [Cytobacillus sp.]|uniref:helix-turn-helix domain-containing protein n=1 Tax=Cytobacillus sp. TaxID=2675269 RepID=UPI0028BF0AFF|nr:helix-turn-helix domain-containing protein [Cytobacillus sp.]